jgi:hypothetical protein
MLLACMARYNVDDISAQDYDDDEFEVRDIEIYRRILQDLHFQAREHVRPYYVFINFTLCLSTSLF